MNLRIEIELSYEDDEDTLEEILVDLADVLKNHKYGNIDDDESFVKSIIRVRRLADGETILIVIPIQDEEEELNVSTS